MRLKATSARFAAFSISSRQSRTTRGLRRVSTPAAPMQKISAETVRYQPMFIREPRVPVRARLPAALVAVGARAAGHPLDLGLRRRYVGNPDAGGLGHRAG